VTGFDLAGLPPEQALALGAEVADMIAAARTEGYQQAIAELLGVAHRTGSPAAMRALRAALGMEGTAHPEAEDKERPHHYTSTACKWCEAKCECTGCDHKAQGGPVKSGQVYTVGEDEPPPEARAYYDSPLMAWRAPDA
jgi:hypothetical protein